VDRWIAIASSEATTHKSNLTQMTLIAQKAAVKPKNQNGFVGLLRPSAQSA
jgi:hypothetical protein